MKRFFILLLPLILFSSCNAHIGAQQYDVPWWMIFIPTVVFLAAIWYFYGKHLSEKEYVCPKCGKRFHPPWQKAAFAIHFNDDRVFTCPHCHHRGFCTPEKTGK